jgi:hypothetical protein
MGYRYQERLRHCRDHQVQRLTLRLTWLPNIRLLEDIPWGNDLNRRVFLALCRDTDLDIDQWLADALRELAPNSDPQLMAFYRESSQLLQDSYYPDGMYLHTHSTVRAPWERGRTALAHIRHWTNALWRLGAPTATRLSEIASDNADRWQQVLHQLQSLQNQIPEEMYSDLWHNASGQRYLSEILPRLVQLRVWTDEPDHASPADYSEPLDTLRDLTAKWQSVAPVHFETMLGEFVFQAVREARLWLTTRHEESLQN